MDTELERLVRLLLKKRMDRLDRAMAPVLWGIIAFALVLVSILMIAGMLAGETKQSDIVSGTIIAVCLLLALGIIVWMIRQWRKEGNTE